MGSPGHPGSGKLQLVKFSPFSSHICIAKLPKPPRDHLVRPQTRLRGPLRETKCLDASYSVPRHYTISVGPYHGVPRAPWVWQNPTCKTFTVFQPNLPYKTAQPPTGPSCATPKPVCGGPCGQPSACMPPTVSQDATQWGPPGTLGPAKSKTPRISSIPGSPKKTQVENPKKH